MDPLRIVYLGNHVPLFSTETHIARTLEDMGHVVTRLQEGEVRAGDLPSQAKGHDLFLHTQTYGLAVSSGSAEERREAFAEIGLTIPTVGYHLDRWWGLHREDQVYDDPFFGHTVVCTADGGHDNEWAAAGVNHRWFPPAVAAFECAPAEFNPHFASDIAFVGSWRGGYHDEWPHRAELVEFLKHRYRDRVRFWPQVPAQPVRGDMLRALYASAKVCVGDSCLVPNSNGEPVERYCSDRIPETVGRGGFLLHPWVQGIDDLFVDGEHLRYWQLGDWQQLGALIDWYLHRDDDRSRIAAQGRQHVLAHHTYRNRMNALIGMAHTEGWL